MVRMRFMSWRVVLKHLHMYWIDSSHGALMSWNDSMRHTVVYGRTARNSRKHNPNKSISSYELQTYLSWKNRLGSLKNMA